MRVLKLALAVLTGPLASMALAASAQELGCIRGDCENGYGTQVLETEHGLEQYSGDFVNGQYHGFGKLVLEDEGITYKGDFRNGEKHGRGTLWNDDNDVYIGEFRNGRRNGHGTQAYDVEGWREDRYTEHWLQDNTENYTGQFRNDVFYGQGTYRWEDGTKYVGNWAANKRHGEGYFDYGNGHRVPREYNLGERVN